MDAKEIGGLLRELEGVLRSQGETNWLRGVVAARQVLGQADGLDQAKSIYESMNQGVGSFADYNVWYEDFDMRRKANTDLDRIRTRLWTAFEL